MSSAIIAAVDPRTTSCGSPSQRRWLCQFAADHSDSHALARLAHFASPWATSLLIAIVALCTHLTLRIVVRRVAQRAVAMRPGTASSRRSARADTIAAALRSLFGIIIVVVSLFAIVAAFGVDLAPLLAGAGLAGVVIGFGAQNLLRDVISGIFMVFEDQYGVGDDVDLGAVRGIVESLTLRVTRVRDAEGVVWHVPNGSVLRVANYTQST